MSAPEMGQRGSNGEQKAPKAPGNGVQMIRVRN